MNRNFIFSTIINPPLVFGVTPSFAFLILFLLFLSVILVKAVFGVIGFVISVVVTIYFYLYGRKRTAKDPYWMNVIIMSFLFERKRPLEFLKRAFTKKDKVFSK